MIENRPHIEYMGIRFELDYSIEDVNKLKEYINIVIDKILYEKGFYDDINKSRKPIIYKEGFTI